MNALLRLRAWQLFALLMLPSLPIGQPDSTLAQVVSAVWMLLVAAWLYAVGQEVNRRLPESLARPLLTYQAAFVPPLAYGFWTVFVYYPAVYAGGEEIVAAQIGAPAALVAAACAAYVLWFTARQLVLYERGQCGRARDCVGAFFLFALYPIGVWVIQPKVNALVRRETVPRRANPGTAIGTASLALAVSAYVPAATVFPAALGLSLWAFAGGIAAVFLGAPRTGALAVLVAAATVPPSPVSPVAAWFSASAVRAWTLAAAAVVAVLAACLAFDYYLRRRRRGDERDPAGQ